MGGEKEQKKVKQRKKEEKERKRSIKKPRPVLGKNVRKVRQNEKKRNK